MMALQKLDRLDIRILCELQQNGRITNVELASAVGLSASPCLKRVRELERLGYIEGYNAVLNISKLLSPTLVYTEFTLTQHTAQAFRVFETGITKINEIIECHLISGGYDYLCKFCCASVAHYQHVVEQILQSDLGVEQYFSYIVIKSPISGRQMKLDDLLKQ